MDENYMIRTAVPEQDFPQLAELLTLVEPEPVSAESLHNWEANNPPGQIRRRWVLADETGDIRGYAVALHYAHEDDGRFYLWLCVHPHIRRQGWGTRLYNEALQFALAHGADLLGSGVREDCPEGLRFAEQRGFTINRHIFESVIDLHHFEESLFTGLIESVEATGISLTSLAAEGDSEAARRKLHALNYACVLDDPAAHGTFLAFDEFNDMWNKADWYLPEGQLLAVDGERYVGLAAVGYFKETNSMVNMITGVDRAYRGRHIALALKLRSIEFAKAFGAATILTQNDSQNGPMLAINRKLGYRSRSGEYRLIKKV